MFVKDRLSGLLLPQLSSELNKAHCWLDFGGLKSQPKTDLIDNIDAVMWSRNLDNPPIRRDGFGLWGAHFRGLGSIYRSVTSRVSTDPFGLYLVLTDLGTAAGTGVAELTGGTFNSGVPTLALMVQAVGSPSSLRFYSHDDYKANFPLEESRQYAVALVVRGSGGGTDVWVNGNLFASATSGTDTYGSSLLGIGSGYPAYSSCLVSSVIYWRDYNPSAAFLQAITANPTLLYNKSKIFYIPAAGGAAYSLACASGALAITGSASTLPKGSSLSASSGAFALTGSSATLYKGSKLAASSGAIGSTGSAATLAKGSKLSASSGVSALSGSAATLTHTTVGSYSLSLSAGSIALTGSSATLGKTSLLGASSGTLTLTGSAATLAKGIGIAAASGAVTVTGSAAALVKGSILSASAGAPALTGGAATLQYGVLGQYTLSLGHGSFALGSGSVSTLAGHLISAASGGITLSVGSASLLASHLLSCTYGTITMQGGGMTYGEIVPYETAILTGRSSTATLQR